MKKSSIGLIIWTIGLNTYEAQSKDFNWSHDKVISFCVGEFKNKKYELIEKYLKENDNNEKTRNNDGWYLAPLCMWGIRYYSSDEEIEKWIKKSPDNIYPRIAKQYNLVDKFFEIRGTDFIINTSKIKLDAANKLLEDGAKDLDDSKRLGVTALWYQTRVGIGFFQQNKIDFVKNLKEGNDKYPNYFPLNTVAASQMHPEWGVSFKMLDDFAIHQGNKSNISDEMYARIYNAVVTPCCSQKIINAGYINKKKFTNGVLSILKKYPSQYNYNNFANSACLFELDELSKDIISKIKNYQPDVWSEEVRNECEKRLSK